MPGTTFGEPKGRPHGRPEAFTAQMANGDVLRVRDARDRWRFGRVSVGRDGPVAMFTKTTPSITAIRRPSWDCFDAALHLLQPLRLLGGLYIAREDLAKAEAALSRALKLDSKSEAITR